MNQPHLFYVLSGVVGLFFCSTLCESSYAAEMPNIVVFISDDLGRLDTSVYGSEDAKTPTMEKLAANGMTFNNAYVASPSCCPNRLSLLTGLMPARHGAHPNHSQVKQGTSFLLPILKQMGYLVLSFGKVAHGRNKMVGCDFRSPSPRDMSTHVKGYFDKARIDQPVCLLVGDRRPHVAWIKESTYDPKKVTLPSWFIDTPETRDHWARYLTDISGMDQEMGRILDITKKQFGDNFIFLFTSDHGGQWPMGKWTLYDSGTRVPLIVSWPRHIKPGMRTDAMVSWVDIIPTLIDLAGGEIRADIDGRSFGNVLLGKSKSHRDMIFTTHTGDGTMNIFPIRSVRIGPYKYIHNLRADAWFTNHSDRHRKDGAGAFWDSWDEAAKKSPESKAKVNAYYTRAAEEFFDLEKDPHELNNLINDPSHAERLAKYKSELAKWTEAQGDELKPHREPYLRSKPIPVVKSKPRPKKKKKP